MWGEGAAEVQGMVTMASKRHAERQMQIGAQKTGCHSVMIVS